MKWKKYTINTTTEAEDIISSMLSDLGIEGVQIEDNVPLSEDDTKGMFIDVLPELPPDDGTSRVSFFLREAGDEGVIPVSKAQAGVSDTEDNSYTFSDRVWEAAEIEKLLKDIEAELSDMRAHVDIGEGTIVSSETEDLITLILVLSKSDSCVCYGKNVLNLIRHRITTSRDISASKREDTKIGSKPFRAVIADDSYIIPPLHSMRSQISRYCPGFLLKLYEGLWNESAFFILPHLYIC